MAAIMGTPRLLLPNDFPSKFWASVVNLMFRVMGYVGNGASADTHNQIHSTLYYAVYTFFIIFSNWYIYIWITIVPWYSILFSVARQPAAIVTLCYVDETIFKYVYLDENIRTLGLYSLSGRTSYRKISWSLEAAKLDVIMIVSL